MYLQKETPPLLLEEGVSTVFATHENGGMSLLGISHSGKGKSCIEIRAWDVMSSLGFTAKEILVQDLQRNTINDGKFKYVDILINQHLPLKKKHNTIYGFSHFSTPNTNTNTGFLYLSTTKNLKKKKTLQFISVK